MYIPKVGDRVRVLTPDEILNNGGVMNVFDEIELPDGVHFVNDMHYMCDKTGVVVEIREHPNKRVISVIIDFDSDIDQDDWMISLYMLAKIGDVDPETELKNQLMFESLINSI